jgi:hypothetical protein
MKKIPRSARIIGMIFVGIALLGASCSSSDSSEAPASQICTPGDRKSCIGSGLCQGTQACAADGQSYDPCICNAAAGAAGSGGKPGSAGQGGASAAGTSGSGGKAGQGGVGTGGVSGGGQSGAGVSGSGQAGAGVSGGGQAGAGVSGGGQAGSGNAGSGNAGSGNAGSGNAGSGQAGVSGAGQAGAGASGAGGNPPTCDEPQCAALCQASGQGSLCFQGACTCTRNAPECVDQGDSGLGVCTPAQCSSCCQSSQALDGICQAEACTCLSPPGSCDPVACGKSCPTGCGACVQGLCACDDPAACGDGGVPDAGITNDGG